MVKLAFYKANGPKARIDDKIIAKYTNGPYSHVEIVIGKIMYSSSPRDGGVRRREHRFDTAVWDYINLENIEISKIVEFYNVTKRDKYDWMGIFGFIVPFKDREKEWFCSEWCSMALKIAGFKPLWTKDPAKISPNRLYKVVQNGIDRF